MQIPQQSQKLIESILGMSTCDHTVMYPSLNIIATHGVLGQFERVELLLQGYTKRTFPGCVKLGEKVAFCLPTAGRRTQFLHLIFMQPGKSLLVQPCT